MGRSDNFFLWVLGGSVHGSANDHIQEIMVHVFSDISVSNVFCETIMYNKVRYANRGDQRICSKWIFLKNGFLKALFIL